MKFQFTLSWMLLAFMVVAFSAAVFGRYGIVVGIVLIGAGAYVQFAKSRQRAIEHVVSGVIAAGLFLCSGICGGSFDFDVEGHGRAWCATNLAQIGMVLHRYEADCGTLPPVRVCDSQGNGLHSWRVLLLSRLDCDASLKQYDRSEPWNGPKNSGLASKMPDTYECLKDRRSAHRDRTRYVAVVGADGAWLEATSGDRRESNPVRIVEAGSPASWMEPRDLSLEDICKAACEPSASGLAGNHAIKGGFFFCDRPAGANALFADGTVRLIMPDVPVDVLRAALLGDRKQQDELESYATATRRVNWPNCGSLAGLIVCFITMLAWPRRKPAEPSKSI